MKFFAYLVPFIFNLYVMSSSLKIDFGTDQQQDWKITNDGVMGGLSEGTAEFTKGHLIFSGEVSLENNGGFSSFKSQFEEMDLSDYESVKIRLKTNGYQLAFTLEVDRRWYMPYFKHAISVTPNEWEVVEIPLTAFKEYRIGDQTGKSLEKQQLKEVLRVGFITNEKRAGNFHAEIDYIEFQ